VLRLKAGAAQSKAVKRRSTKQTVFGKDAKAEPIGIYSRRICVGFAFFAALEPTIEQALALFQN